MNFVFNKSCIGYSHISSDKPCQDYSASYQDNERTIITCCDGHGGDLYIRSNIGSKLASDAVMNVFKNIERNAFFRKNIGELTEKIKLSILCEYNDLVEKELSRKPLKNSEMSSLGEEYKAILRANPEKAFGTTLSGALLYKKKLVIVGIGDTEVLGFKDGKIIRLFDNADDPAGNITYSMCQEDAYKYLRVAIVDLKELDGVVLCTDGLSGPYQSYDNFNESFIKPMVRKTVLSKSTNHVCKSIEQIASKLGIGDDVSLSFVLNENAKVKYYR